MSANRKPVVRTNMLVEMAPKRRMIEPSDLERMVVPVMNMAVAVVGRLKIRICFLVLSASQVATAAEVASQSPTSSPWRMKTVGR